MTRSPDDDPSAPASDDPLPDTEPSSCHGVIVAVVNALMAAMTFGAMASMVIAFGRLFR